MHDNTIHGLIAQNKAELRAIEKGYLVSKPITECARYDMVVDNCITLERVQVKYAGTKNKESTGSCKVDFRKKSINGNQRNFYTKSEIDAVLVYIPDIDKLCYFPISFVENKSTITIRYDKPKNNQMHGVINAYDYLW